MIKIKFDNKYIIKVKKKENNIFKYIYEKKFKILWLLQKYMKRYNDELIKSEKNKKKRILININDFDISKSMNINNKIVLIDYFDALISYEKYWL